MKTSKAKITMADYRDIIMLLAFLVAVIVLIIGLIIFGATMPDRSPFYMQIIYSGVFKLFLLGTATVVFRLHRMFEKGLGCLIYILVLHVVLNSIVFIFCLAFEEYSADFYRTAGFFQVNESFGWRMFFIAYIITVSILKCPYSLSFISV